MSVKELMYVYGENAFSFGHVRLEISNKRKPSGIVQ